jgi:hypothetical protein
VVFPVLCAALAACRTSRPAADPPVTTGAPSASAGGSGPVVGVPPLQPTPIAATAAPSPQRLPPAPDYSDPVDIAARYAQSTCTFDWREAYGTRERRSAAFLTTRATQSAAPSESGRAEWDRDVVRRQLVGSCHITAAQQLDEAPNTATTRYVDVVAGREISAQGQPVKRDQAEYTYVLLRERGRWLVDGATAGG